MPTIRTALFLFISSLTYAQAPDKSVTFEAATVKPFVMPTPNGRGMIMMQGPSGGPGSNDPGRIHYPGMNLKTLLMNAYDVKSFQVLGPALLDSERFDIDATMAPGTTKEQFRVMLQNLLAERFKLTFHRETKELPMYSLVVGKNGPKMKESVVAAAPKTEGDTAPSPAPLPSQPKIGADGFPELPQLAGRAGIFNIMMNGRARIIAQQQTIQDLAGRLSGMLSRPVTDNTALSGKYDFTLTYSPEGATGPMGPLPPPPPPPAGGGADGAPAGAVPEAEPLLDIFGAVQAQLGLKLEAKKGPVELIVVDHAEKTPTEN
jgi:uncharacterized protein (TIGR03435 family)